MSDSEVSNMSDSGSDARSDVSNRSRSGTPRSRSRSCKHTKKNFIYIQSKSIENKIVEIIVFVFYFT